MIFLKVASAMFIVMHVYLLTSFRYELKNALLLRYTETAYDKFMTSLLYITVVTPILTLVLLIL